uniref:Integron gene cassette protein n=1 Tax=Macrostomum lignano TaxID=282301 RepID=A0A1I8F878_9PLAT
FNASSNRLEAPYVEFAATSSEQADQPVEFVESARFYPANASLRVPSDSVRPESRLSQRLCGLQESDSDRLCTDCRRRTASSVPRFPASDLFSGCIGEVQKGDV